MKVTGFFISLNNKTNQVLHKKFICPFMKVTFSRDSFVKIKFHKEKKTKTFYIKMYKQNFLSLFVTK